MRRRVSTSSNALAGDVAGSLGSKGYYAVRVNDRQYRVHRIVWEMHNGPIPRGIEIDHIDRDPSSNRIGNLRLATRRENIRNTRVNVEHVGVYRHHNGHQARVTFSDGRATKWYRTEAQAIALARTWHAVVDARPETTRAVALMFV